MLPLLAGRNIDRSFVAPALAAAVGLVVHCARDADGARRVQEVVAPIGDVSDGRIRTRILYSASVPADRAPVSSTRSLARRQGMSS